MKKQDAKSETAKRIARTEAYAEKVRQQFALTVNEILALNKSMPTLDEGVMFSFDDQSMKVQKQVEELLRQLHSVATMAIKKGITLEWEQANIECDKLVQSYFGKKVLSSPEFAAWTQRNENARDAFIARSDNGLNLSDRVWQSVRQLRDEMEVAMTVAIGEGDSAASMSRKVREYLNEPDLMFRRFRYKDAETGEWKRKWKKRIKDETTGKYKWIDYNRDDYKTGAGVYKSSAKNAMRVARTETNIAYRRADNERWQQMDFVLGQRIQLSHNHPKKDICDKLQGDYPAEFVFDGWHPQCFCFATPILMDEEEMAKVTEAFLRGEKYTPKGKKITSYPQNFKDWVTEHSEQIAASRDRGTEPYFIKNNAAVIDNILNPKDEPLSIAEIAAKRHAERTPEKEKQLREYWEKKKAEGDARRKNEALINTTANNVLAAAEKRGFTEFAEIDTTALQDAIKSGDTALIKTQTKALASQMAALQKQIKSDAQSMITKASDFGEIDATALSKAITSSKLSEIKMKMNALQAQITAVEAQEQAISDLIPKAHEWHKTISMQELLDTYSAIKNKLSGWAGLSLEQQAKKLQFEAIDFLGGNMKGVQQKYPNTWKVSQAAYLKKLDEVNLKIETEKIKSALDVVMKWSVSHPKSYNVANLLADAQASLNAGEDIAIVKQKAALAIAEHQKRLAEQARRDAKKALKTSTLNTKISDDEYIKMAGELAKVRQSRNISGKITLTQDEIDLYIELEDAVKNNNIAEVQKILAKLGEDLRNPYSNARKDIAVWAQDTLEADNILRGTCGKIWQGATEKQKDAIFGYTQEYHPINEPLRGLQYIGSPAKTQRGLDRIPHITDIIDKSSYSFDIWLQRGDDMVALKKFGLANYNSASDTEVYNLVGAIGDEGAFWSSGVAKGKGFGGDIIFNIYAPRGTKMMYCEPFSDYGHGDKRSWDGVSSQSSFGYESEILLQRGTKLRITKVQKSGGQWYIDVEVISQNYLPFPYSGGYPYK